MRFSNVVFKLFLSVIILVISGYYISEFIKVKNDSIKLENFFNVDVKQIEVHKTNLKSYTAVLEIPKISLKRGLYDIESPFNNVNTNIEINSKSDMPDINNGNLILEAHSGFSFTSYFNNLEKLKKGDLVKVYYKNIIYNYFIDDFYDIDKTGKAVIKRDYNKNTITLITCKKNTNKQVIYIGYLEEKKSY